METLPVMFTTVLTACRYNFSAFPAVTKFQWVGILYVIINAGLNTRGICDFLPKSPFVSESVRDWSIVTMDD